ncbi:MAG: carboxypeptidase regulatory-like domain-containing protein [Bryobacteraceae bacterium]|nr:carboxypeptidase regulatory-like domain-containing protein [Bryobacteraceae bacterium]
MNFRLLLPFVVIFAAAPIGAQLNRGSLTGQVTDPGGSFVANAKIVVVNPATNARFETESTSSGQYTVPNLPPGRYEVTAVAPGFKTSIWKNLELGVTQTLRLDLPLELGVVAESISVTTQVPRLQTDNPEVGTSLSNKNLMDLPLSFGSTRSAETFAYKLSPGVSGNDFRSNINGSTAFSKETVLDGVTVTSNRAGHFGESSVSVEALQELKITTSGMSAEYGRAQGGVFNFVMRSGTNDWHGTAYGAMRNEALNANTFANNARGVRRNTDRRANYAFSGGGPVVIPKLYNGRNRTFFYTTYERFRQRQFGYGSPTDTAPQPEWLDGDFSRLLQGVLPNQTDALGRPVLRGAIYDPATFRQLDNGRWVGEMFAGNRIPSNRFSAVSRNLSALIRDGYTARAKDPDGSLRLVNNALRPSNGNPEFDQHQFSIKADQIIDTRHKLAGSLSYNTRPRLVLDDPRLWNSDEKYGGPLTNAREQKLTTYLARASYDTNLSPTVLNSFTAYYNLFQNPISTRYRDIDGAGQIGIKNLSTIGFPTINWGGPFVNLTPIGDPLSQFSSSGGYGILNTISLARGKHFIKMGVDFRRNYINTQPTAGGSFTFAARSTAIPNEPYSGSQIGYGFASFLLGIVDGASLADPVGLGGRRSYLGLFIQDDFKVGSRFTVNLGLRWEFQPPFVEQNDRLSSWNPVKKDPESQLLGAYDFAGSCAECTGSRSFGSRTFRDFGPRIGFAWRASERWTLRGAYGVMFEGDLFNGTAVPFGKALTVQTGGTFNFAADNVNPWRGIFNWDNGLPTDRFLPPTYDQSWGNRQRPAMIDPRYGSSPYVQMWNFNLQREIFKGAILDIGYVANKATGLRSGELGLLNQIPRELVATYGARLSNAVTTPAQAAANGVAYPFPGFRGTVASALRAHPQVQGNNTVNVYGTPDGFSTYHSLQVILNKEFASGLTTYANFTWSKNLTNVQSSAPGDNEAVFDKYALHLEKQLAPDDRTKVFKGFVSYDLPFGRGRALLGSANGVLNSIVGGWRLSAIVNYASGAPLTFTGTNPLPNAWNGGPNRINIASGVPLTNAGFNAAGFDFSNALSPANTYLNKAAYSDPGPLQFGTAAKRPGVRGFGQLNEDFGLQKNMRFTERVRGQLRLEMLNGLNRHILTNPVTSVVSPQFGQVTGATGSREMQFGLRVDF